MDGGKTLERTVSLMIMEPTPPPPPPQISDFEIVTGALLPSSLESTDHTTRLVPGTTDHHPLQVEDEVPATRVVLMSRIVEPMLTLNFFLIVVMFSCIAGLSERSEQHTKSTSSECEAGFGVNIYSLFLYEILAFCFFCASFLMAYTLKLVAERGTVAREAPAILRAMALLALFFLVLAVIMFVLTLQDVIQIRFGGYSCGSANKVYWIIICLWIIASTCLIVYDTRTIRALI